MSPVRTGVLFCATVLAAVSASAGEPVPIRRVAFIVGANDGGKARVQLRYAESDAKNVASVLERLGGVAPGDLKLLLGPDRTRFVTEIEDLRARLATDQTTSKRVELLVYYSGHSDEEGLLMKEERYPYSDFRKAIDTLPADVRIAILDSCASGAMTRRKGGTWKPPFMVDESSQVQGHAILTSTGDDEAAQESDRVRGSFFTHYLLTGLRGAADATHDGKVTLNEAYQFAYNETLARTESTQAGAQHPAYDMQLSGTGDLVLTDLRQSAASLTLAPSVQGRLFVRDASGRLAAELRKASGAPLDLGLEPGLYAVTLLANDEAYGARLTLVEGRKNTLDWSMLKVLPKEYAVARGGKLVDPVELPVETPKPSTQPEVGDRMRVDLGIGTLELDLGKMRRPSPPVEKKDTNPGLYEHELWHLGLFPGVHTGLDGKKHAALMSVNFMGELDRLEGVEVGLISSWAREEAYGIQASGVFNWAGGELAGAQLASVFNVAEGRAHGVQLSGGFNVAGGGAPAGTNAAGEANPRDVLHLAQIGSVFNVAGGPLDGAQLAGVFNWADGDVDGAQLSSVFNVSDNLRGAQISVLNIAGNVQGAQIGLVNIAGVVDGVQVGLVNIADDVSVPIGLLNFVSKGRLAFEVFGSEFAPGNLSVKLGGANLYTLVVLSTDNVRSMGRQRFGEESWSPAFGVGSHFQLGSLWLDVDATVRSRGETVEDTTGLGNGNGPGNGKHLLSDAIITPRVTLGWNFWSRLSLFAGAGANFYTGESSLPVTAWSPAGGKVELTTTGAVWPSVFAGLQF